MKLSKKIKCLLFSLIGIVSVGVAAIASPVVVLEQNRSNNTVNTSSTQIDSTTSNKLASFSTNWEVKTKAQEDVESQFNQFLNYDGNESSNMRDITLLVINENSIKNKQLMTTPFVSEFADIAFLLMGVSTVADSFGWIAPTIFGLASLSSWIISSLMMFTNN